MYQIYFDRRDIRICTKSEGPSPSQDITVLANGEGADLADVVSMFENSPLLRTLVIQVEDPDTFYGKFASCFTAINAAGGLVENPDGEFLFIFRNGVWDLPKGKQEDGEDIALTAIREVEEECGVHDLTLGDLLCITRHTYHREGKFYLKHTYWYKMTLPSREALVPQLEEDITSAVWVKRGDVDKCLENTYPSIKEVISRI